MVVKKNMERRKWEKWRRKKENMNTAYHRALKSPVQSLQYEIWMYERSGWMVVVRKV